MLDVHMEYSNHANTLNQSQQYSIINICYLTPGTGAISMVHYLHEQLQILHHHFMVQAARIL
jgi:hypothetical protein